MSGQKKIHIFSLVARRFAMPVIDPLTGEKQGFLMFSTNSMSYPIAFGMGLIRYDYQK